MELQDIRYKIDETDNEILRLFMERMELSGLVAREKAKNGQPVYNRSREREILGRMGEKAGDMEKYSYVLFSTLMQLSKARQLELMSPVSRVGTKIQQALTAGSGVFPRSGTIACQGAEGANSQAACDRLLPRGRIMYVKSFEAVFDAVESGLCQFGVLPIENSSNGSVREVYHLLQTRDFFIVRSTRLCIRHELLAKKGAKPGDIKEIFSHEQAIGQCSRFLSTLDGVKVTPCTNTAIAAQMVSDSDRPCAAIASHSCGELYGLETLNADIQNSENNYTRFVCISKRPEIYPGANRISLVVDCSNTPGALYEILGRLAARGVNMNKLESCPVTGRNFEFIFFLELEADPSEPGVLDMLEDLERNCQGFNFLGAYQEV